MRKIFLYPFGILFGVIASVRRRLFNAGILNRKKVAGLKTIVIGNLAVGGSGKTPMVIFLANAIKEKKKVAVLSRGYGRKSTGFLELNKRMSSEQAGDEPLEILEATGVPVFVCEDRVNGLEKIKSMYPETEIVLLDDAFQHLGLMADTYLLLTEYDDLFCDDLPMPAGRLREFPGAARHASAIIVTKVPEHARMEEVKNRLMKYSKPIFFARYAPGEAKVEGTVEILGKDAEVFVFSGLANNKVFLAQATDAYAVKGQAGFRDHHAYDGADVDVLNRKAAEAGARYFLTTRKDALRLGELRNALKIPLAVRGIEVCGENDMKIDNILLFLDANA